SSMCCVTPSSMTKSLPAPCILLKRQREETGWGAVGLCMMGLVDAGLTFRSGFEASMYPIILRRVLAHIFFDQGIHTLGGLFQSTFAGEVGHGFQHLNMVVAGLGIQAGNHGNDQCIL